MGLKNTSTDWGWLAKLLHWLIAIGVIAIMYLGLEQSGMERGEIKNNIRFIHASIATGVLILMTLRLIWRWLNQVPAHPDSMAAWQRIASKAAHGALYAVIFVQLFAGALIRGTAGDGMPFFGVFTLPVPVSEDRDAHEFWEEVHEFMWKPIAVLLALHVLAALFNHFVQKNDVLRRMTVGSRQPSK